MTQRKSFLSRVWRKFFPEKPKAQPLRLEPLDPEARLKPQKKPVRSSIESLEGRIAPAILLSGGKILKYADADGDLVTITFSKSLFPGDGNVATDVNNVFKFSIGNANDTKDTWMADKQQLQLIDLSKVPIAAHGRIVEDGISFTVSVEKSSSGGDGFANIGGINTTLTLGSVKIHGDLGFITAGNSSSPVAIKSLDVSSLGVQTATQSGSTPTYTSTIIGAIGSFHAGIVEGAYLHVTTGTAITVNGSQKIVAFGKIGQLTIDHDLEARTIPAAATGTAPSNDGLIQTDSDIGSIKIGSGDRPASGTADGIIGGWGVNSGAIISGGKIGSILINGDIFGGVGEGGGSISSVGKIGDLTIKGSVTGGDGANSGGVASGGSLGNVTIGITGHSGLNGGAGDMSGSISSAGNMGKVKILGDIHGGTGLPDVNNAPVAGSTAAYSGSIAAEGNLAGITVLGSVKGGGGFGSGTIGSNGNLTSVTITGSLIGGDGQNSGSINAATSGQATLGSVVIGTGSAGGDLVGGAGQSSGSITSGDKIGSITVKGVVTTAGQTHVSTALAGGTGAYSASIYADGMISSIQLGGDLVGSDGDNSASITAHTLLNKLTLGNATGGNGSGSASIFSLDSLDGTQAGNIGTITGGTFSIADGATTTDSARIEANGDIKSITLNDLQAGTTASGNCLILSGSGVLNVGDAGRIQLSSLEGTIQLGGSLGSLTVKSNTSGAAITTAGDLTALTVGGSFQGALDIGGRLESMTAGSIGANSIVHVGNDIGALAVHGNIDGATFTAAGQANPTATVDSAFGRIIVTGHVSNTNFLAGYDASGSPVNGNAQIGAVQIGGDWSASNLVAGISAGTDSFFGTTDDAKIGSGTLSKIASITIGGQVSGTADPSDHFGFVAEAIGAFKIGHSTVQFVNGVAELTAASTNDVTARIVTT